jgi:hypothetical protein
MDHYRHVLLQILDYRLLDFRPPRFFEDRFPFGFLTAGLSEK